MHGRNSTDARRVRGAAALAQAQQIFATLRDRASAAQPIEELLPQAEAALRAAGVTGFVFAGGDALATLQDAYRRMDQA